MDSINAKIITVQTYKFVVSPTPSACNINCYKDFLVKHNIKIVVNFCESVYDTSYLDKYLIEVIHLFIPDGSTPTIEIVEKWFKILDRMVQEKKQGIAIHCVSGLGRAPVMLGIAMLKLHKKIAGSKKITGLDTVARIRHHIPGALNTKQLEFLDKFKLPKKEKSCIIM